MNPLTAANVIAVVARCLRRTRKGQWPRGVTLRAQESAKGAEFGGGPKTYDNFRIDIYDESRRLPDVKRTKKPTNAEVAILRVLWDRGPSTVRDVARAMGRESAYTTILKLMQNMSEKRLVRRDESSRTHVYAAATAKEHTQRQLVADLLERVFDGSAKTLVMQALAASDTSPEELTEIRKLLDGKRGGRR